MVHTLTKFSVIFDLAFAGSLDPASQSGGVFLQNKARLTSGSVFDCLNAQHQIKDIAIKASPSSLHRDLSEF